MIIVETETIKPVYESEEIRDWITGNGSAPVSVRHKSRFSFYEGTGK